MVSILWGKLLFRISGQFTLAQAGDGQGLALVLVNPALEDELEVLEGVSQVGLGDLVELDVKDEADVKGVEELDEVGFTDGAVRLGHLGEEVADV